MFSVLMANDKLKRKKEDKLGVQAQHLLFKKENLKVEKATLTSICFSFQSLSSHIHIITWST